jgi:uncharacterized membrane protein HdeD (DUF308 family)
MLSETTVDHVDSKPLLEGLAENWWLLLLRGTAAIVFGVLAFAWPGPTLLTLALFWGAFALTDGVLAIWAAIAGKAAGPGPRWWLAGVGMIGILAGLVALFSPAVAAAALLIVIAAWAITAGLLQIWGALKLRKEIPNEWLLIASGVLSVAFGIFVALRPESGAVAISWLVGAFALLYGLCNIALALGIRDLGSLSTEDREVGSGP